MFLNRNKKNKVYPCKPQFYCIKVGFNEVRIIQACFRDAIILSLSMFIKRAMVLTLSSLRLSIVLFLNHC